MKTAATPWRKSRRGSREPAMSATRPATAGSALSARPRQPPGPASSARPPAAAPGPAPPASAPQAPPPRPARPRQLQVPPYLAGGSPRPRLLTAPPAQPAAAPGPAPPRPAPPTAGPKARPSKPAAAQSPAHRPPPSVPAPTLRRDSSGALRPRGAGHRLCPRYVMDMRATPRLRIFLGGNSKMAPELVAG